MAIGQKNVIIGRFGSWGPRLHKLGVTKEVFGRVVWESLFVVF